MLERPRKEKKSGEKKKMKKGKGLKKRSLVFAVSSRLRFSITIYSNLVWKKISLSLPFPTLLHHFLFFKITHASEHSRDAKEQSILKRTRLVPSRFMRKKYTLSLFFFLIPLLTLEFQRQIYHLNFVPYENILNLVLLIVLQNASKTNIINFGSGLGGTKCRVQLFASSRKLFRIFRSGTRSMLTSSYLQ